MAYKRYEDRVKYLVSKTKNPDLFPELSIPRTTANYWIKNKVHKSIKPKDWDARQKDYDILKRRVDQLSEENRNLKSELACIKGYLKILKRNGLIRNILKPKVRINLILLIKNNKGRNSIRKILNSLGVSFSQYNRWKNSLTGDLAYTTPKRVTSLTYSEIQKIKEVYSSTEYFFYPIHALSMKGKRTGIVYACPKTWSRLIKELKLKKAYFKKVKYKSNKLGIQSSRPNELWHIDVTEIKIQSKKYYLQVILDNKSRIITGYKLTKSISGANTSDLLIQAMENYGIPKKIMSDAGKENLNQNVNEVLQQNQIKHYVAKRNTMYSNSKVEAFFRMLKENYLRYLKIKSKLQLEKGTSFYIQKYNEEIPHISLGGRTPMEVYQFMPLEVLKEDLLKKREEAFLMRKRNFHLTS